MKNFKSQEVDTPGVIARVSKLFHGYNRLILGFNTFLPDGYKISLEDIQRHEKERMQEANKRSSWARNKFGDMEQLPPGGKFPSQQQQAQPQAPPPPPPPPPPPKQPSPAKKPPTKAVEFDHAISYVTTIKRRFANDPTTYHTFLEILHTYQKEQRGIKEVLDQVVELFQDHPDLLREFVFFLPDAVQELAKERLNRVAHESEMRQQQGGGYLRQSKFIDMTAQRAADKGEESSYVYNSAVERQFFDATREALTAYSRDGGQAWAEFVKCLDMYAQEILSRAEMLSFVEPLLGKRNAQLLDEFQRILQYAGQNTGLSAVLEDAWHSVPLSEIDFSRCRRCSPSYRALPRDYPAPPCSERSDEEKKVLNDIWVSLPVGSEESYTFRHMRRNTYEETLFRVEDERFEIDMVIDSNSATLRRLEPIAEEIASLARQEIALVDAPGRGPEGTGIGGKRFRYTFDMSILGVIHRNSIARIYGDAGQEMLDLLVKNPTVAVPVVVERLRQKEKEWKAVRERLNRNWKKLAAENYYKSLDHRGLTWRTTDKRATSTRTLSAEIRDRAANGGKESAEALKMKLDKAKEEHGTFYEVTMGGTLGKDMDLTFLPKPDRRLFTPHLSLMYENNSWAQRDAYRILAYALERGAIAPSDKERCHRLWLDFLALWFDLGLNWMQKPAVTGPESTAPTGDAPLPEPAAQVVSEEEEEDSMDEDNDNDIEGNVVTEEMTGAGTNGQGGDEAAFYPLPPGAHVSTVYGPGQITEFRRAETLYVVKLAFGSTGYLQPDSVLCSLLPVEKSAHTRELRSNDPTKLARSSDQLVFGTQSLYLFFRLHQILVQRLNTAKKLAYSVGSEPSLRTMVEHMEDPNPMTEGRKRYEAYLSLVYALLDGGVGGAAEGGKYEDRVRSLLGHGGYELATMDKLIAHIWKNLQSMAQDETMWSLVQLYRRHLHEGSFLPEAMKQEAAYLAEGESLFAFQYCPIQGSDKAVLHTEYLGVLDEDSMEEEEIEQPEPKRQKK